MRKPPVPFLALWASDKGLTVLLVFLVLFLFVGYPLVQAFPIANLAVDLLFTMIVVSGVAATVRNPRVARVVGVIAIASLVARWLRYQSPTLASAIWETSSAIMFLSLLTVIVLVQVFREGPITRQRIEGAVAVYLLLGLVWGFAYSLVEAFQPGSFSFAQQVDSHNHHLVSARLTYYSFVTLTTVGFGDVTPVEPTARSLTILEALIGQLFPAILLARLVSMELYHRQQRRHEER